MSNIYTTFTQNVENTPDDDPFSSENPWESPFQGIDTPTNEFYNVNSAMSSRHQNTARFPPITSNHPMTLMLNPHQNHRKDNGMALSISLNPFIYS